ncbi:hypothetical protein MNBD_ACTINO02-35 [hydrothermal vent metagenome]|uniref:Uncharacterized protein n=1 Tax=hydrothermal vent metagenome TaxID=652676 RepID=A0A3B0S213_9ZZZZ
MHLVVSTVTRGGGAEDNCEIVCSGVRDLHIFNESSSLWDFVEVTAASARPIPDGSMVLDLTMWTVVDSQLDDLMRRDHGG